MRRMRGCCGWGGSPTGKIREMRLGLEEQVQKMLYRSLIDVLYRSKIKINDTHRGRGISRVNGSVCFILKFRLPSFSSPLPSMVRVSKQNKHGTLDP